MSLARVKTWNPGDILTANDQNAEFNNILNNPISLVSPTTGAINFNSQAHTNFVLENVATTPTAATSGRIVYNNTIGVPQIDQGSVVRSVPLVLATAVSGNALVIGTTAGAFQMTTVGSTTPGVLVVTSSGALQYAMGSSTNTVFTVTSSGSAPTWQPNATASTAAILSSQSAARAEYSMNYSPASGQYLNGDFHVYLNDGTATQALVTEGLSGRLAFPSNAASGTILQARDGVPSTGAMWSATKAVDISIIVASNSTSTGTRRVGLFAASATSTALNGAMYFSFNTSAANFIAACQTSSGAETTLDTGVVAVASSFHRLELIASSTSLVTVYVDGTSKGTIATNIPSIALAWGYGVDTAVANLMLLDAVSIKQDR